MPSQNHEIVMKKGSKVTSREDPGGPRIAKMVPKLSEMGPRMTSRGDPGGQKVPKVPQMMTKIMKV